jgi:hypothetical protein
MHSEDPSGASSMSCIVTTHQCRALSAHKPPTCQHHGPLSSTKQPLATHTAPVHAAQGRIGQHDTSSSAHHTTVMHATHPPPLQYCTHDELSTMQMACEGPHHARAVRHRSCCRYVQVGCTGPTMLRCVVRRQAGVCMLYSMTNDIREGASAPR